MNVTIPDNIPDSVRWKLFRAQEHLAELGAETQRYYKKNPAKLMRQENGTPDQFIGKIVPTVAIPARIPLIIGDFLKISGPAPIIWYGTCSCCEEHSHRKEHVPHLYDARSV